MEWVPWAVNQVQCKCQEVQVVQEVQVLLVPEPVEQGVQVLALLAEWEELAVWGECLV